MFREELAIKILKLIDEKEMTLETLAEVSNLSRRFIGNIIYRRQSPTLDSFEKLCAALEVTPNDLLMSEASMTAPKSQPMSVTHAVCYDMPSTFPICPSCESLCEENQSYCKKCGQRLRWNDYPNAEIIYFTDKDKPKQPALK